MVKIRKRAIKVKVQKRYDKSTKNKIPRIPRKRFSGEFKKLRLQR